MPGSPNQDSVDIALVVPTVVSFISMPLSMDNRCFKQQWRIIPFFDGSIFEQMRHLNSDVIVGILVLFFIAHIAVVGADVEASSEAW